MKVVWNWFIHFLFVGAIGLVALVLLRGNPRAFNWGMRQMVALNFLVFLMMGQALFLHLSVVFPEAKSPVLGTSVEILIYFPIPLLAFFFVSLRLFQPWADRSLNRFLHSVFALAVVCCVALAATIHSYCTAGRPMTSGSSLWHA